MIYDKVVFYNFFGNGDIFLSREFVKELTSIIKAEKYYYSHPKPRRILNDIAVEYFPPSDVVESGQRIKAVGNDLYINTWLGLNGSYVTQANSCSISHSYRMYNDILSSLNLESLPKSSEFYIPNPDYSKFELDGVNNFISKNTRPFIILDNGNVQSGQAKNFEFSPIIEKLCDSNKDVLFLVTHRIPAKKENLIFTSDITNTSDGFDLYEISYLSQFCNLIVGRSSGPAVFCMTYKNCMDSSKYFFNFTYRKEAAHVVVDNDPKINSHILWSDSTTENEVFSLIDRVVKG